MEHTRRLYHVDPAWGHSVAGYVTDYVIFAAAAVCATGAFVRLRTAPPLAEEGRRVLVCFIVYACFSGVSFLAGGIAHNMIDSYGNGPLGLTWGSRNSGFLYPWTIAVVTQPTAVMASLGLVFMVAAFPAWSKNLCYFVGAAVGIIELVVAVTEDLGHSGTASAYLAILAYLAGGLLAAGLAVRRACNGAKDWLNPFQGRGLIMLGLFLSWVGYLIASLKPASCTKTGVDLDLEELEELGGECPFSEDFNHNAVFHTFIICAVVLLFAGAVRASADAKPKQPMTQETSESSDTTISL
jgi:hypothetical protein